MSDERMSAGVVAQSGRYMLVGVVSTLVDIAATWVLLRLGFDYRVAITVGFATGVGINYLLHRHYTFRSTKPPTTAEATRYLTVVALNYLLTILVVTALHSGIGLDPMLAKVASLPLVFANGFALSRWWIFRP